jgi:hypothetical protein
MTDVINSEQMRALAMQYAEAAVAADKVLQEFATTMISSLTKALAEISETNMRLVVGMQRDAKAALERQKNEDWRDAVPTGGYTWADRMQDTDHALKSTEVEG